jgi:hypothetical protein
LHTRATVAIRLEASGNAATRALTNNFLFFSLGGLSNGKVPSNSQICRTMLETCNKAGVLDHKTYIRRPISVTPPQRAHQGQERERLDADRGSRGGCDG